jgi:hypothetical protein
MTQGKTKVISALSALLLIMCAAGCSSRCVLIRSECYDVTGKVFAPKLDSEDIPILTKNPERPAMEIGVVKVEAPWGTGDEAIMAEMKSRARRAGADALVVTEQEQAKDNKIVFCGKVFDTKKSIEARGVMIVYADKVPDA